MHLTVTPIRGEDPGTQQIRDEVHIAGRLVVGEHDHAHAHALPGGGYLVVQTVDAATAETILAEWDARGGSLLAATARVLADPGAAALAAARGA